MAYRLHPDKLKTVRETIANSKAPERAAIVKQKEQAAAQQQRAVQSNSDLLNKLAQRQFLERRLRQRGLI